MLARQVVDACRKCLRWVDSRRLEKSYLESVPSSQFGPILAVRRALVMASLTVPARETCRTTLKPQQKFFLGNEHYRWRLRVGRGGLAGESARTGSARERGRPGERGAVWPPSQMSSRHSNGEATGSPGASADFHRDDPGRETENLKTWKTGNLTSSPASQPSRISVFQDFRFSPDPGPRNPAERVWMGVRQ